MITDWVSIPLRYLYEQYMRLACCFVLFDAIRLLSSVIIYHSQGVIRGGEKRRMLFSNTVFPNLTVTIGNI